MKVFLMHRDRDFEVGAPPGPNDSALMQDLELDILLKSMARDDHHIPDIARKAILVGMHDTESILYRQRVLKDCLAWKDDVLALYAIANEAIESRKKNWFFFSTRSSPGTILYSAVRMLQMYVPLLMRLRKIADESTGKFQSDAFIRFFSMIQSELNDEYFATVHAHLQYLSFSEGVLLSARLGKGLESCGHTLRKSNTFGLRWFRRLLASRGPSFSFSISARDDAGCTALGELRDRGINFAADALARSADHIESFFNVLLGELAFYVGCLNLHEDISSLGEPVCFPTPEAPGSLANEFQGLYNICLSLHMAQRTVGNDVRAIGKNPVIITGINEGGKSTFLRSIGVAQLLMQCGMFVPAISFRADIAPQIGTHYRRREDRSMTSGKLDEELARMDALAAHLKPYSLMLFNESFAATNEREGSEIASQITRALVENGIRVFFVTHLYSYAIRFDKSEDTHALLLRAERQQNGTRTFRIVEGAPSERSYGEELYLKVFGTMD